MARVNVAAHLREITAVESAMRIGLQGNGSAALVGTARLGSQLMREHVTRRPDQVAVFPGGPDGWRRYWLGQAERDLIPWEADEATRKAYAAKREEYAQFCDRLEKDPIWRTHVVVDRFEGKSYLIEDNRAVRTIMAGVARSYFTWFLEHPPDRLFLQLSARASFRDFLDERPDVLSALRFAQRLPADYNPPQDVEIKRPELVEMVELAIAILPIVGNAVTGYEVVSAHDLFGYRLTDLERAIMAATILLPVAGRLVKAGRLVYSEVRLTRMFGEEVQGWRLAIAADARASANPAVLHAVNQAAEELRLGKRIAAALAKELAESLPRLVRGVIRAVVEHEARVVALLAKLSKQFPALAKLDAPSLLRVLRKGPNVSNMKGQLLEELLETRVLSWLRDPAGLAALGVKAPRGKRLDFVPGHLLLGRDGKGITDGMLVYWEKDVMVPVAVFEAKAGKQSAVGRLHLGSGDDELSADAVLEFVAAVKDELRDRALLAEAEGRPFTATFEEVASEFGKNEKLGQIQRDIERLSANDIPGRAGLTRILVGGRLVPVRFDQAKVKFFGVVLRGSRTAPTEAAMKALKLDFEVIGVELTDAEFNRAVQEMLPLSRELAKERL